MKCPRCHVEVPTEALRCPDCKLPKPKSMIAQSSKNKTSPSQSSKGRPKSALKPGMKPERRLPRWVSIVAGAVSIVFITAVGAYTYWYFSNMTSDLDQHLAQPAMQKLREMPSKHANLTIEQYMKQELEKSRRVGNLVSVEGWPMQPVQGNK